MTTEIIGLAVVFFAVYHIIKSFTDFLLKRKLIKMGHVDKADILAQNMENREQNWYPTLKWGLVAFFAGAGLILIEILSKTSKPWILNSNNVTLLLGIELMFIAAGFLIYFFIMNRRSEG